jgi:hypothetical protein
LADELRHPAHRCYALLFRAGLDQAMGRSEDAFAHLDAADQLPSELDQPVAAFLSSLERAKVPAQTGEMTAALATWLHAREVADSDGSAVRAVFDAFVDVWVGDDDRARAIMERLSSDPSSTYALMHAQAAAPSIAQWSLTARHLGEAGRRRRPTTRWPVSAGVTS